MVEDVREPTEFYFASGTCAYIIDKEHIPFDDNYKKYMILEWDEQQRDYCVAYCRNCTGYDRKRDCPSRLKQCKVYGCNNWDTESICANHQCYICLRFPSKQRTLKCCDECNQTYCFVDGAEWNESCGSIDDDLCKHCYLKKETL